MSRDDEDALNALNLFKEYFIKQWLEAPFNNWQIFNTPPGFATTQNPEESLISKLNKFSRNLSG